MKIFIENMVCVICTVILMGWMCSFVVYPAFAWTFLGTCIVSFLVCIVAAGFGWIIIDFPGTMVFPFVGISLGTYLLGFSILHVLYWKGVVYFPVGWTSLIILAIMASVMAGVGCFISRFIK